MITWRDFRHGSTLPLMSQQKVDEKPADGAVSLVERIALWAGIGACALIASAIVLTVVQDALELAADEAGRKAPES